MLGISSFGVPQFQTVALNCLNLNYCHAVPSISAALAALWSSILTGVLIIIITLLLLQRRVLRSNVHALRSPPLPRAVYVHVHHLGDNGCI
jgi:hypothetical protein